MWRNLEQRDRQAIQEQALDQTLNCTSTAIRPWATPLAVERLALTVAIIGFMPNWFRVTAVENFHFGKDGDFGRCV